jgi:hypothetical protein
MSNRCPSCQHFVSLEASEEENFNSDPEVDEFGNITANFRLVVNCGECGDEMKESEVEFIIDASDEVTEHITTCHPSSPGEGPQDEYCPPAFEVECVGVSVGERYSGTSKTPMRFQKKFYVVDLDLHVTCNAHSDWAGCNVSATEEVQALYMEDLN